MKRNVLSISFFGMVVAASLSACGGGGGGGGAASTTPAVTVTSFPLQTGYKALIANGLAKDFTVSGSCAGSGRRVFSPATTAATFEGSAGLSATGTLTMSFTNCTPGSITESYTNYYDTNYVSVGGISGSGDYGVYLTPPTIPTSVAVGDSGTIGTETYYTDSSKTMISGTVVETYAVEADTSSTAIVNVISKSFDAAGALNQTAQTRYRISAEGTLTVMTTDIQAAGSDVHLILTYQ